MTPEPRLQRPEHAAYLADESATRALGAALAHACEPGMTLLLEGPLGAGKTTLVQGFAAEAGAAAAASPSFVLAHYYAGARYPIWHLDLYRIEDPAAIDELDLDYYLGPDGITLVEWPHRARGAWPANRIEIRLSLEAPGRRAVLRGVGNGEGVVRSLSASTSAP